VVTSLPPFARSAAITFCIAVPLAERAAFAVGARLSTPAETSARSGTASTEPLPVTVTESVAAVVGSAAPAPSGRSTPASAAATSRRPAASAIRLM
jgi:hypothetical protein